MSGTVSRLFAQEREAQIAYEKALKEQYGKDWQQYRYKKDDHNADTESARLNQTQAFLKWHRAALPR